MHWLMRIAPAPRIVGQLAAPPGWIEPERVIYDHEVVLYSGSDFLVRFNGDEYRCGDGQFLIVPPGRSHATINIGNRTGHRFWVHFSWEAQDDVSHVPIETYHPTSVETDRIIHPPPYVPEGVMHGLVPSPAAALDLHERISYRWNLGDSHEQLSSRALLLELLIDLLDDRSVEITSSSPSHMLAYRVRRAIESAVHTTVLQQLNLSDHLEELGYSYEHLSREFRKVYGFPPAEYLNRYRTESAKSMLAETTMSVDQISRRLGFSGASYFSRVFKDRAGVSPTDYRRMQSSV